MSEGSAPPRALGAEERELLEWLLPAARPGYATYRDAIAGSVIIAAGRWGDGDWILGREGDTADLSGPMERIVAWGAVVFDHGERTVAVHEECAGQIEVQFTRSGPDGIVPGGRELRRYSYSEWSSGMLAPGSATEVREVPCGMSGGEPCILVIAPGDERVWLHEQASGMNHLLPLTSFYTELMRQCVIRDAKIVFAPKRLFTHHGEFSDRDLARACAAYNAAWKKITLEQPPPPPEAPKRPWYRKLFRA